jgi:hypothetical protein
MACELSVYNTETKTKQLYVCDEDNAAKMVENDHAASASGQYTDVKGNSFTVDWKKQRLVSFKRGK